MYQIVVKVFPVEGQIPKTYAFPFMTLYKSVNLILCALYIDAWIGKKILIDEDIR